MKNNLIYTLALTGITLFSTACSQNNQTESHQTTQTNQKLINMSQLFLTEQVCQKVIKTIGFLMDNYLICSIQVM